MRSCALRILDAATISIAFVILRVLSTDLILPRISLPTAMTVLLGRVAWSGGSGERLLEGGDRARELFFGGLVHRPVVLELGEERGVVRLQVLVQAVLERQHLLEVEAVHEALVHGPQRRG